MVFAGTGMESDLARTASALYNGFALFGAFITIGFFVGLIALIHNLSGGGSQEMSEEQRVATCPRCDGPTEVRLGRWNNKPYNSCMGTGRFPDCSWNDCPPDD